MNLGIKVVLTGIICATFALLMGAVATTASSDSKQEATLKVAAVLFTFSVVTIVGGLLWYVWS